MKKNKLILFVVFTFLCKSLIAQDEPIKIKYGPYLQQVGNNEATIVWTTNKQGVAWVEIAPDDDTHFYAKDRPKYYHTIIGEKNIGTLHRVHVDGLDPNAKYRYRIFTQEVLDVQSHQVKYGDVASTSVYKVEPLSFSTLDDTKSTTNFLMVNDIHAKENLFSSLISNEDLSIIDFVLLNGDMMSQFNSEEELFKGFLDKASDLFAKTTPMFMVRGNHETRGVISHKYMDYFPSSTGKPYYTFKQGPAFFIVLDPGEDKPDNDIEYYGLATYDKYREDQTEWLKDVVSSEEFKEAKVKIVVIHIPPVGGTWHGNLELNRLFMPILNAADIDLMLCGHEHRHRYMEIGDDGANFPMLVNSNIHSAYIQIDENKINIRIKDDNGKLFKNIEVKVK